MLQDLHCSLELPPRCPPGACDRKCFRSFSPASLSVFWIDTARREAMPSIWWLAPLMILWVNMHAGFALGLVLIVLTIAGLLLDWLLLRKDSLADVWRRARPLCWVLIICGAAVSLNPSGIRIYSYPFETLTSRAMMQFIEEWRSPDFHQPMFQALALLIVGTFSVLALSNKRPRPGELLLLAATGWATLRSARNVPFFALRGNPSTCGAFVGFDHPSALGSVARLRLRSLNCELDRR